MTGEKGSPMGESVGSFSATASPTTDISTRDLIHTSYDVESGVEKPKARNWLPAFLNTSQQKTVREREDIEQRIKEITETEILKLEDCPEGYSQAAAFLSSEPNFSLYRGFGYLFSRVLLNIQDELVKLEQDLKDLDDEDNVNGEDDRLRSRRSDIYLSRNDERSRSRQVILNDIQSKLELYSETLRQARGLHSFQRPSNRDYHSVRTWFWNKKPFVASEMEFIKHKEDIVSLHSGREWSTFDVIVERVLMSLNSSLLRRMFTTPELRRKTDDKNIRYFSRSRVEYLVSLIITSVIFVLLVSPVVIMYKVTSVSNSQHATFNAIAILIIFTLLFSGSMGLLTTARRHEIFAASAAYCAVLVVFISNFNNQT